VDCDIRLSFDLQLNRVPVRVQGINAPELSTSPGKDALAYAQTLLPVGLAIQLKHSGHDKYGRFLAEILFSDGTSFGDKMLQSGHAVPFMV
jgi:endonuclease YncB( thermonuclease family)